MPEKQTIRKAKELKHEGKAPTTQAGPFVEEEMRHIRRGKHGARSTKQAIAIGLSKARESGVVDLPPPKKGRAKESTRESAERARARGRSKKSSSKSTKRSRAVTGALKREGRSAASKKALSRQAKSAAARRKKSGKATASRKK